MRANISALAALAAVSAAADPFDWQSITPSHDLAYHDCYDSFRCARLLLPLDWLDPKPNETIALALIQSPAVVPVDDPTYGGPVLSNPGGPGGSGVDHLRRAAAQHHDVVDTPGRRHFEFVSFDPRGIGRTTPQVNCYPDSRLAHAAASLEGRGSGGVDASPAALSYNLGLAAIRGDRCAEFNGELLKHVGTPSVARDMLAVVEKIDEYNKKQSYKGNATGGETTAEADKYDDQLELRDAKDDKHHLPRLQYMGFSYGTVLGNYFASMFPERIGRLLLDGVCDIDDYATGDGWLTNTVDTDEMADVFFQSCFGVGSDACALYRHGDASGSDIATRFWAWAAGLDESPVFATNPNGSGDAAVVRSGDLHGLLFGALYSPFSLFPDTAKTIDEAMCGNTTALWELVTASSGGPLEEVCPIAGNSTATAEPDGRDPQSAILCGDGEPITGRDAAFWRGYVERQLAQSAVAGASWSTIRIACSKWRTPAKWQFHGPFTAPAPSRDASKPEPGRPAAPILFLSNRLDPVTPLRAALKAAAKYPGAGLLVQEALGHCVLGSPRSSDCTRNVVRRYFDEGVVPDGVKSCEAACELWEKCETVSALTADEPPSRHWRFPLHV